MSNETDLIDSAGTPYEVFEAVNTASSNMFGISIIISSLLIGVLVLLARGKNLDEILIYMGGLEFILCLLFIIINWIPFYLLMLPIIMLFAGIILTFTNR